MRRVEVQVADDLPGDRIDRTAEVRMNDPIEEFATWKNEIHRQDQDPVDQGKSAIFGFHFMVSSSWLERLEPSSDRFENRPVSGLFDQRVLHIRL